MLTVAAILLICTVGDSAINAIIGSATDAGSGADEERQWGLK